MSYYCDIAPQVLTAWLEVTFIKDVSHLPELHGCRWKQINFISSADNLVCFFSEMLLTTTKKTTNICLMPLIQSNLQLIFIAVLLK